MVWPLESPAPSDPNGGLRTASTPSGGSNAAQNSRVSSGPLYIFQFPAISTAAESYDGAGASSDCGMTATPGSGLPSSSSSAAPPPVEAHETWSVRPSSFSARIESAPPTTENPSAPATASATALVPAAKRGHSNTPMGPFQKMVFARKSSAPKRSRVSGPMSRPSQPSGSSSNELTVDAASASNAAAATTSVGSTTSKSSAFSSRSSSAILPPIRTASALPPSLRRTPSLSSTSAPPETSTNGRSTSPSSFPSSSSSRSSKRPAYAGSSSATPTVEACAR